MSALLARSGRVPSPSFLSPCTSLPPCRAARIHPEKALGVDIGDVHVIRNAGERTIFAAGT